VERVFAIPDVKPHGKGGSDLIKMSYSFTRRRREECERV